MDIEYTGKFKKHFDKRIKPYPNLVNRFHERLKLFLELPQNPILKDHPLKGKRSEWRAFSITGDIRIVYVPMSKNYILFLDIGTHNQVY